MNNNRRKNVVAFRFHFALLFEKKVFLKEKTMFLEYFNYNKNTSAYTYVCMFISEF